jgi:hypothetical protein
VVGYELVCESLFPTAGKVTKAYRILLSLLTDIHVGKRAAPSTSNTAIGIDGTSSSFTTLVIAIALRFACLALPLVISYKIFL